MTQLTNLRLAAGLAHTVPDAELQLHCEHGAHVTIGRIESADMTPCQFRAVMIAMLADRAGRHHGPSSPAARVTAVTLGGSLEEVGGGVVRSRTLCGMEQRWIATTVPWTVVLDLLDDIGPAELPSEAMNANVKPDSELGVTVLVITTNDHRHASMLDRVASDVASRLMTEELMRDCVASATNEHDPRLSTPKESDR